MKPYPLVNELREPALRVAMSRAPRLIASGSTMHVVARCNNREFCFTTADDFEILLAHLRELVRTYEVTLYAYTLLANHVHLLPQPPMGDALSRPLRWLMTQTAKAFHQARGRRGHFWERRYRAVVVEDELYVLAALRYLDRNPVRVGLVADPTTYPWSSCAAYALGVANPVIELHPRAWRPVPIRKLTPASPAGPPSGPWGPRPSWPGTPRGEDVEESFSCLRKFRHLESKRCLVPFRAKGGGGEGPVGEGAAMTSQTPEPAAIVARLEQVGRQHRV